MGIPPVAPRRSAPTHRLFLALWPEDTLRRAIAEHRDRCRWPQGAAPVADARLHLTLHFIGNVAAARLDELAQSLRVPFAPFDLLLDRCAAWPHGVAVLEPSQSPGELLALHAALGDALGRLRLPVEQRRYRAHVTLARNAAGARLDGAGTALRWRVRTYALVRSHPDPAIGYQRLWSHRGAALA